MPHLEMTLEDRSYRYDGGGECPLFGPDPSSLIASPVVSVEALLESSLPCLGRGAIMDHCQLSPVL